MEHIKRMKDEKKEVKTVIETIDGRTKSITSFFDSGYAGNLLDEHQIALLKEQFEHMVNANKYLGKYSVTLGLRIDYDTDKANCTTKG